MKKYVKWKKGKNGKYYAYLKPFGYVLQFSSYKKMRKAIKSTYGLKKMKGFVKE